MCDCRHFVVFLAHIKQIIHAKLNKNNVIFPKGYFTTSNTMLFIHNMYFCESLFLTLFSVVTTMYHAEHEHLIVKS